MVPNKFGPHGQMVPKFGPPGQMVPNQFGPLFQDHYSLSSKISVFETFVLSAKVWTMVILNTYLLVMVCQAISFHAVVGLNFDFYINQSDHIVWQKTIQEHSTSYCTLERERRYQKYSRLRYPLQRFSSLCKAESVYEGRLKGGFHLYLFPFKFPFIYISI